MTEEQSPEQQMNMEDFLPSDVYTLAKSIIPLMYEQAWIYMGLTYHPKTKSITLDMEQAKFAIDCATYLFENLSPRMPENERKQFEELLTNLRLNFVSRLKE
ncbi:MAG: DUF1844 domain-containing protein [bacterium]